MTAASPAATHAALAQNGSWSTSASMAPTPRPLTTTGATRATKRGPMRYMSAAATRVSSEPMTTSTITIGLPRLPRAVPTVRPATAAGSTQANTSKASETRNCSGPYDSALRPGAKVRTA